MINAGHKNPRRQTEWTRYSSSTTTYRGHTDTSRKGHDRRNRSAKTANIGLYFFLAALLTVAIGVLVRVATL